MADFERISRVVVNIGGIEPLEKAAQCASIVIGQSYPLYFESARHELPLNYFDLVICNDVIEHLPDHNLFLQQIKAFMKDDSILVGSIPNVRQISNLYEILFKKDWEYKQFGILDSTHLRFFYRTKLNKNISQQ